MQNDIDKNTQSDTDTSKSYDTAMILHFKTRWPIKQVGEKSFEIIIPTGFGNPVLDREFMHGLSDGEVEAATEAALRAVVVVR